MKHSQLRNIFVRVLALLVGISALALVSDQPSNAVKPQVGGNHQLLSLLTAAYGAELVALDPAIRDFKLPDQIPWKMGEGGSKSALLYGDPSKPGFYVQLLHRGPNIWSRPHYHENDRFITVLEGTFWVGSGKFDPERTVPLKPGTFVRDFANQIHFDGSKDDGTTLEFVGMGPASAHYAEAPAPAPTGPVVIDPTVREVQRPEDLVWKKGDAASSVSLYGSQDKPGVYVQYLKRDPNQWSRLHFHPTDRFITVMGGKLYIGTGTALDKDKTIGLTKGGFVRDIAQGVHYDGAKDEGLWIQLAGIGPATSTTYMPPK